MAHKKAGGSSRNGRDSQSKRLGIKHYGGEQVNCGQYPDTPAWYGLSPWQECRAGQGLHTVCQSRR